MSEKEASILQEKLQELGRYQILQRIGRGGMGDVWLCEDPRLKRRVAVKTLPPHSQQDQEFVQRFEREAQAAAALTHPHILQVHDYGEQPLPDGAAIPYIVMPHIEGGSLSDRIAIYHRQQALMPPQEAFSLLRQAAEAIDFAHKKRIVHRDIKPANMLLRDSNWLLLADFGIARILSSGEHLTQVGYGFGTPEYMAPEQAQGRATITSDNYSLAVIAYQLFTGRLPFQGETAIATSVQHLTEPPQPPCQFAPWLTPGFERVLMWGLAKDPARRPALASEFVAQLEQALTDKTYQPVALRTLRDLPELDVIDLISTQPVLDDARRKTRLSRRRLLANAGMTTAALVGIGAAAWGIHTLSETPPALSPLNISAQPQPHGGTYPELQLTGGHTKSPSMVVWSPDSRYLYSGGFDGMVFHWDLANLLQHPVQGQLYSGMPLTGHDGDSQIALSPDGKLALANYLSPRDDSTLQIAVTASDLTITSLITIKNAPAYYSPIWLPNDYLLFGTGNQFFQPTGAQQQIWVVDSNHPQRQWLIKTADGSKAGQISYLIPYVSQNRLLIAIVYQYDIEIGEIQIGNQVTWQKHTRVNLIPPAEQNSVTFRGTGWSADGKSIIALLDGFDDPITGLFSIDWQASNPRRTPISPPTLEKDDYIWTFACNPAGTAPDLAINTWDGHSYLIDAQGRAQQLKLQHSPMHPGNTLDADKPEVPVFSLSWSPDGKWLAACVEDEQSSILIWKVQEK